jgi:hypothetical protein
VHGHVSAPAQLYASKATLLASRGSHGHAPLKLSDEQLKAVLNGTGGSEGLGAHVHRYVDEFTFRLNEGNVARHTLKRLDSFVDGVAGKRLTYKALIQ